MRQVCFYIQFQILLWYFFWLPAVGIESAQQVVPSEIQEFCKYLFFREDCGHTLFGQKPMSLSNHTLDRLSPFVRIEKFGIRYFCEDVFTPWMSHRQVATGWNAWLHWQEREDLIGILLGFGATDATRFQQEELLLRWKRLTLALDLSIGREFPPISYPIRPIASYSGIVSPYSLGWKGDCSDEETAQLCLDYQKTQHFLEELSIQPNWFLVVYQRLFDRSSIGKN